MAISPQARPFGFKLGFALPFSCMTLLLVMDPAPLDIWIEHLFYVPDLGFVGRHSYWLENILHERAKQLVIVINVLAAVTFVGSLLLKRCKPARRPLGYLVLALGVSTAIVPPLKTLTAIQCPWSLTEFGGHEAFSPLIGARPETSNPGRCWPGGHASAGFSLIALFFCLRDRRPRLARAMLILALLLGATLSVGRMMQGAHFLSHNLWTMLLDWSICLALYRLMLYRHPT
ncbi:phosphatase PAP2 family protein [Pseudomonas sp. Marseille-QA0892]